LERVGLGSQIVLQSGSRVLQLHEGVLHGEDFFERGAELVEPEATKLAELLVKLINVVGLLGTAELFQQFVLHLFLRENPD